MPFLELFDESLDINSTESYELSLQASPEGLAFCLLDTIRNKFVLIRSSDPEENKYFNADKINELVTKDDFLLKRFKKVSIVMPSSKSTIVPAQLFDPSKKDEYFSFNHIAGPNTIIIVNKLKDPDAFLISALSKPVYEMIKYFYPSVQPCHHLVPLFDQISHNRKSVNGNYIHIHIEKEFFNLVIFNHNLLKFCNSFNHRNINDILYYVLNVFKNLNIKQEETIYFSGLTEKYDDLSSAFSIYIRNIKFAGPAGNFTFSYVFNEMERHRFINLFSIVSCE
jgi:hypothetical protein